MWPNLTIDDQEFEKYQSALFGVILLILQLFYQTGF